MAVLIVGFCSGVVLAVCGLMQGCCNRLGEGGLIVN